MIAVPRLLFGLAMLAALPLTGCAHTTIPGTSVPDRPDQRAIFDVLVKIRENFERRDPDALLALVSRRYFEDNGTPDPRDDYGYIELHDKLLHESMALAKEVYLSFEVYDIIVHGDSAVADVRYVTRTRLDFPSGRLWDNHRDFNRIDLSREDGNWRITGGL